jgi:polysaccharide export outer membrane protein
MKIPLMTHTQTQARTAIRCATLLALLLILGPAALHAQFSGPALAATADTNQPQHPTTDPSILMPGPRDPVINIGDQVLVRVFGTADYAPPTRVASDGFIQLPLIGLVRVAGLTVNHASDLIAQQLKSAGMYLDPQVSIQVTESLGQSATVAGELHAIVPLSGDRRLLDVLAAAGPMPVTASHTITILRNGVDKPIIVDLGTDPGRSAQSDIPILPGDKIIVSRVGVIYMLGAFKNQGVIPLQQNSPLTLMQATAISQGAGFEGKYKDLRIVRTVGLTRTVVKLDIQKVLRGTAPDPVLQADDIIFLPADNLKAAIKGGGINIVTSFASLALIGLTTFH